MTMLKPLNMGSIRRRLIAAFTVVVFAFNAFLSPVGIVNAQEALGLPAAGTMLNLSPVFAPPLLKGIKVYRNDPFRFDFILDTGDTNESDQQLKTDSNRLIKYFLASLTVPEKDLWVNLSPYEKDRIVPEAFGQTEMGRDLLAQDYILKQITASVIYPEGKIGKEFWGKVYAEAQKRYGSTDIPVDTFNKVWIIPEKATVYENKDAAFVVESKLKVMLEEDYLALEKNTTTQVQTTPATNKLGSEIVREVVIPILEKEVNEGKNFAPLRQVYHSLILATWYKRKLKDSIMGQAYADQKKTAGIDIADKNEKEKIWQQYVDAFKKGAYNFIKEEYDPVTQQTIPRKYFSGGTDLATEGVFKVEEAGSQHHSPSILSERAMVLQTRADPAIAKTAENRDITKDRAMKTIVMPPTVILKRLNAKRTSQRDVLMGFMRDANDKIQPVFSNIAAFQSTRDVEMPTPFGGWNPEREIRIIPVELLGKDSGVHVTAINKTTDWQALPNDLKALFEGGTILVTASGNKKSKYAILMAVTPQDGNEKSEGRSGVLLKDGLPIVIAINGKEFVLEIKGVGNAEGGFDADYRFLRGGAQVSEAEKELGSLEMKRKVGRAFGQGDAVRAVAELNFSIDGRQQGYLIRLSPGSVRATYNDNEAFQLGKDKADRVSKVAQDMGRQMGEYFSEGFIATSHPENLVVIDDGRSFVFTDYADILPIHIFPTELEGHDYELWEVILSSLHTVSEIPSYKKYGGFKSFLGGLSDGLSEARRISAEDKVELLGLNNFEQIRDFLWKKFMAADYYKAIKVHGKPPVFFKRIKTIKPSFLKQLVSNAKEKHAGNQQKIIEIRARASGGHRIDEKELQRYEIENRILEDTSFTVDGIIAATNSPESRKSFKEAMQVFSLDALSSPKHYIIWSLWDEVLSALIMTAGRLRKEVSFLETVLASATPDLIAEVKTNLEEARKKLAVFEEMSLHDFYHGLQGNSEYAKRAILLPYSSTPSKDDAESVGGIDLNPAKLDLKTQNNGGEIKLDIDSAMLQRMQNASGVTPVIINILPLDSLQKFLGVQN